MPVLQDWAAAILSGLWSSLCELLLFVLVLWFWSAGWLEAVVAALGAGLAELVALMPAILSARFGKQAANAPQKATWQAITIERSLHLANHVLVRMLAWLGLAGTGEARALAAAFGLLALTEATQALAQARNWDLLQPRAQLVFLSFLGTVIVVEATVLALWW
jgi:hypothetical protein